MIGGLVPAKKIASPDTAVANPRYLGALFFSISRLAFSPLRNINLMTFGDLDAGFHLPDETLCLNVV